MKALNAENRGLQTVLAGSGLLGAVMCGALLACAPSVHVRDADNIEGAAFPSSSHQSFASFLNQYPQLPAEPAVRIAAEALGQDDGAKAELDSGPELAAEDIVDPLNIVLAEEPREEPWLRIREIGIADQGQGSALVVKLSRTPELIDYFSLSNPNRLVVDVAGPVDGIQGAGSYEAEDELISRVRIGVRDDRIRIVADLAAGEIPEFAVQQQGAEVALFLGAEVTEALGEEHTLYAAESGAGLTADAGINAAGRPSPTRVGAGIDAAQPPASGAADLAMETGEDQLTKAEQAPAQAAKGTAVDQETIDIPLEKIERVPERPLTLAMPAIVKEPPASAASGSEGQLQSGGEDSRAASNSEEPGSNKYRGKPISLDFKNADLQNVLRIIADVSGLNIVATDDVAGRVTIRLKDVPWDQALEVILQANGLDKEQQGNIIRVSSLDRLREEREKERAAKDALQQAESLHVKYIRVNYAKVDKKFIDKIKTVLSDRGNVTWDSRTNTIVIRDIQSGLDDSSEMIAAFDLQTPQVLIESAIVEAGDDFVRAMGIQWGYNFKAGPAFGNNTGFNFPGTVGVGGSGGGTEVFPALPGFPFIADFPAKSVGAGAGSALDLALGSLDGSQSLSARISALEQANKVKVISRPRVVTINNVKATIQSLRILRVRLPSTGTVISTGEGGTAGTAQAATEQIPIGITLEVTPQVSSDGFVFLDLRAKSSTTASTSTDDIPDEVSREAESHVLVKDGETFVLGGIYRDETTNEVGGVPYLKNLPALGWLFRNRFHDDKREELLVFVTPHIIKKSATVANLPSASELWQSRDRGDE